MDQSQRLAMIKGVFWTLKQTLTKSNLGARRVRQKSNWADEIPYDPTTGNVPHWAGRYHWGNPQAGSTMKNHVFTDTLHNFQTHRGGRSAVYVTADSKLIPNRKYNIFLKDFETFIMILEKGVAHQVELTYCKRGSMLGTKITDDFAKRNIP